MKKNISLFFLFFFLLFTKITANFYGANQFWNDENYLKKLLDNSDLPANSENKEKLKMAFSRALVILRDNLNDEDKEDNFVGILSQKWAEEFSKLLHEDFEEQQKINSRPSLKKRFLKWSLITLAVLATTAFVYWFFWYRKNRKSDEQTVEEFRQVTLQALQQQEYRFKKQIKSYEKKVNALNLKYRQQTNHVKTLENQMNLALKGAQKYKCVLIQIQNSFKQVEEAFQADIDGLNKLRKDVYEYTKSFAEALNTLGSSSPEQIKQIVGQHEYLLSTRMTEIEKQLDLLKSFDRRIKNLESVDHAQTAEFEVAKVCNTFLNSSQELSYVFENRFNELADKVEEFAKVAEILFKNQQNQNRQRSGSSILPYFNFREFVDGLGQITKLTKSVRYLSDEIRKLKAGSGSNNEDLLDRINNL